MRGASTGCGASVGALASDGAGAVAAVAQTLSLPPAARCRGCCATVVHRSVGLRMLPKCDGTRVPAVAARELASALKMFIDIAMRTS